MNNLKHDPAWLAAHNVTKWNFALYNQYLEEYCTDAGEPVTAYENFLACNGGNYVSEIDPLQLNVSCTPLFNPAYYLENLTKWANQSGYMAQTRAAASWTTAGMQQHIFNDLGMSLWEHFKSYGLQAEINPSELFDTHAYLEARVQAMNASDSSRKYTIEDAKAALLAEGVNPVQDSQIYGRTHNIEFAPVTPPGISDPVAPAISQPINAFMPAQKPVPDEPDTPEQPGTPEQESTDPAESERPPQIPDIPDCPDEPDLPKPPEADLCAITIEITECVDYNQEAVLSNGLDIDAYYDISGSLHAPLFDSCGPNQTAGDIQLKVAHGNLAHNSPISLYGQNIEADIYGADGLPKLEIWATGTVTVVGGEISSTPTYNPAGHITGYEGINDWIALRSMGEGESSISLGNGHDIFELFDTSTTCIPAILPKNAQIETNLGICSDYLEIGDLRVEGAARRGYSLIWARTGIGIR